MQRISVFSFTVLLAAAFLLSDGVFREAKAQARWRQTVEIIAPVQREEATGALLDTLVQVAERRNLRLRRSPEDGERLSFSALEEALLSEGVDFSSANRVFITYRFEADQRGLQTTIEKLYFIYRPEGGESQDIPIFSVDATEAVVQNTLTNSGLPERTNEVALRPFYQQLLFHNLPESQLVALGGEVIRDQQEAERERERVLRTIRRFLY